jgi:hypothetical protein
MKVRPSLHGLSLSLLTLGDLLASLYLVSLEAWASLPFAPQPVSWQIAGFLTTLLPHGPVDAEPRLRHLSLHSSIPLTQ